MSAHWIQPQLAQTQYRHGDKSLVPGTKSPCLLHRPIFVQIGNHKTLFNKWSSVCFRDQGKKSNYCEMDQLGSDPSRLFWLLETETQKEAHQKCTDMQQKLVSLEFCCIPDQKEWWKHWFSGRLVQTHGKRLLDKRWVVFVTPWSHKIEVLGLSEIVFFK